MKRFERGCSRESADSERDSDPANYNKNEDIRETEAVRLRIPEKGTTEIEKTEEVTEKHASAADTNTRAIFIASQTMENHPLGRSLSGCDDHEADTHDLCRRNIHMRRDFADYSLMPPDLTDSEYEYDSETDTEDSMPAEHHPSGSSSAASTSSVSSCKNHLPGKFI